MAFSERFKWYCQKVIPLVYDESLSYYEVLCKLTEYIRELSQAEQDLETAFDELKISWTELQSQFGEIVNQWADYKTTMDQNFSDFNSEMNEKYNTFASEQQTAYNEFEATVKAELSDMADTLEAIKNGEYIDFYETSLKAYIDENLQVLVTKIAKQVQFGLNNNGQLVAYIPPDWDFLEFGTIQEGPLYGHLTIRY